MSHRYPQDSFMRCRSIRCCDFGGRSQLRHAWLTPPAIHPVASCEVQDRGPDPRSLEGGEPPPCDPISRVKSLASYPLVRACSTRPRYLAVFLWAASAKLVSKHTVSSARRRDLHTSSHQTKSGRRSVGTMWRGKL